MSKIWQKILLLCEISQKSADLFSVILRQFPAPGNLSPVLPIGPDPRMLCRPQKQRPLLWSRRCGNQDLVMYLM